MRLRFYVVETQTHFSLLYTQKIIFEDEPL